MPQAPVLLLLPRDVPLGGPRAMNVRRTLPQRGRSTIGAWCFIDHYGPDEIAPPVALETVVAAGTASGTATGTGTGSGTREEATGGVADGARRGMVVPPHPHTGLQTVSWLFEGEIEHRDSAGSHAPVLPGELNLMTAGRGISHSEVSTPETRVLHGVQALARPARGTPAPGAALRAPEDSAGATRRRGDRASVHRRPRGRHRCRYRPLSFRRPGSTARCSARRSIFRQVPCSTWTSTPHSSTGYSSTADRCSSRA
ncbi:pirin family protein [Cryobacterium breve]|uniref:pirin family protein n=1 Tax=Cryobacterium breve TaxID=1259258 RepID=UPI00248ADCEE|nr:pirin family protein [Cryobacterium breve]